MTDLQRLHRALVDAVQNVNGDLAQPVTVSQVYQELVPYRSARSLIGFEMNADYEYALLRLLAGEDDLVRLEPPEVREVLQRELESPNPNVSLFRAYANCDVYLSSAHGWSSGMSDEPVVEVEFEEPEPEAVVASSAEDVSNITHFTADTQTSATRDCAFCGGPLPDSRLVNFCPHCGNDLTRQACSNCGEILEASWRFCVSCGAPAPSYGTDAN
jgi:predicted RNA-binding Zn-ribbon protein involved in translation (DUF1610 family)